MFCLIFWAGILKGESLDICWGNLSSPGVSLERGMEGGRERMEDVGIDRERDRTNRQTTFFCAQG